MAVSPVYNPTIPFVGPVNGGLCPGKMIRIQGSTSPTANRFAVNVQCGPNVSPRDDIALHISVRFLENMLVRNSLQGINWGPEETYGGMPLIKGQPFEVLILCEPEAFKIAVNGQHFTEFPHRMPYYRGTHVAIDGDVMVTLVQFEGGNASINPPVGFNPPVVPPQPIYTPGAVLSPPGAPPYPTGRTSPLPYGTMPSPSAQGYYPPGRTSPLPYGAVHPPPPPGYAGYPPSSHGYTNYPHKSGNLLDKAGAAISGVLGGHHGGHKGHGAGVGTALGAGVLGAALTGHLSPKKALKHAAKQKKKALKAQKKSHKKALKYGLPIAGAGIGAYALSKGLRHGMHGWHSSSSSSSSSEEE